MKPRRAAIAPAIVAALASQAADVPYFPAAADPELQGFVRVINHEDAAGEVTIRATDDGGDRRDPITLAIGANESMQFNSDDLELGNDAKGLSAGIGSGTGDWRLDISSDVKIQTLAYIRTPADGFFAAMVDTVPRIGHRHRVPTFNPGSNTNQASRLRLLNAGDEPVAVAVAGIDDAGVESRAGLSVPARGAVTVTAQDLEDGLGDGTGKWQLVLQADGPLTVMSLLATPSMHVTNLSAVGRLLWRGLVVEPESRCPGAKYDRDEYGTGYRTKEDDIIDDLGAIFGPYTGTCYESANETTIDHIVALHQAHHSGMCLADSEAKRAFGSDLANLTLASDTVNTAKGAQDAYDWMPATNGCWFARRVLDVKRKYAMTVDREEAEALELVLAACESTEIVKPDCAAEESMALRL